MAETTRNITMGFLPFGSDDESVLFSDSLTSEPTDAGYNAVGSPTFDDGGVLFAVVNADGIYFDMSAMDTPISNTDLYSGCTVSFEIESAALDEANIAHLVPFSFGVVSSNDKAILRHNTAGYWELNNQFASRHHLSSVGKGAYARIDYVFTKGKILVYYDYLFAGSIATPTTVTSAAFAELNLGFKHPNISGNGIAGHKIKNLQLSNRVLSLPTHPEVLSMGIFGDSMPERGSYPHGGNDGQFALEEAGQSVGGEQFIDAATLPTIQRELAKAGIHIGRSVVTGQNGSVAYNAVKNYTVGGSSVDPLGNGTGAALTLEAAIDLALDTDKQKFDVSIIWIGINDVTFGWSTDASPDVTLDATWKGLLETQINRLIDDAGANHVFLCTVVYKLDTDITNPSGVDSATAITLLEARQDIVNTYYSELENEIAEVTKVDLFSKFGSNSPNTSYLSTAPDDGHPSSLGSVVAGQEITRIIQTKIG